jgi:serine protease Do
VFNNIPFICLVLLALSAPATASERVTVPTAMLEAEQARVETIERIAPSVVAIFDPRGQGGGSGVLIDADGYTVTNFHVVNGLGPFIKCGLNDGQVYDAVLVGIDPTGDVALIKLLGRDDFPHAEIGDSDTVRVGDWTFALGNPFLLATDFQPTVTYGMVSGVNRYQYPAGTILEYTDCIQVDTSINPGNSGGPLFSEQGQLIGINGRISVEKRGRVNVGAGYAISINQVMNFLDHLKSGRIVDHATLGATVTSTSDGTVVVSNILETSEAYRRGLRRGDELISFGGRPIRSVNQFKNILGIYPKGWKIPLSFRRDGKRHDVQVRLMGLHRSGELTGERRSGRPRPPDEEPRRRPDGPRRPGPPDGDDPPDRPPLPIPHPMQQAKPEIPEEYADLYEERTGFANYHFNRMHQERLLEPIGEWGDFASQSSGWAVEGQLADGTQVQVRMLSGAIAARLGDRFAEQDLEEDFQDAPAGSGGLLAALEQFRQMLIDPGDYFTELVYLGSEPLDGTGPRVDVIETTKSIVTSRWYFDRDENRLIGFDTAITDDADPCEIRFEETFDADGFRFPRQWTIRHAGEEFAELTVESLKFFDPSN